jgi:hypothetical protein
MSTFVKSLGTLATTEFTEVFKQNKYPHYTFVFQGNEADCRASGSTLYSKGWDITFNTGSPFTCTADITADVDSNHNQIAYGSGSYITVNWGLHYNATDKELLHVNTNIIPWINNITTSDKVNLEYQLTNGSSSLYTGSFTGGSGSIGAAEVVWTMTQNGAKTIPVLQQIFRQNKVVPSTYIFNVENTNIMKIYSNATLITETGLTSNWYSSMASSGTGTVYTTDDGQSVPCWYGWQKQPPSIDQNGSTVNIQQEWFFGLYFQNESGTPI